MNIDQKKLFAEYARLEKDLRAKNRELEIEASLERVRTVAMSMKKPDDMLEVCRTISLQLQILGVKEIRNIQTAIFYVSRGTYMNYEYYAKHKKTFITETFYTDHKIAKAFAAKMLKGKGEIFINDIKGKKVKDWLAYQKTTNVFIDNFLEKAHSLSYYWHSLGPVALGISTYVPLKVGELKLFQRFLNVFELSYMRYLDIEQANTQAREAQIQVSLERVRAGAMSMYKPGDLPDICEILFKEFQTLGFSEIRNAMINIHNDEEKTFVNYDYSDEIGKSSTPLFYNIHPLIEKQIKEIRSANDAFSETVFKGKDLKEWKKFRKERGEKDDPRTNNISGLYYYFYSIGAGSIGISTFGSISGEKLELLKRFRNVFNLAYQRYADIALAEAQAREAQIQLSLERVRARGMAMYNSNELADLLDTVFRELTKLDIQLDRCIIMIHDPKTYASTWWLSNPEPGSVPVGLFVKYHEHKPYLDYLDAWKNHILKWEYLLEGNSKKEWDSFLFSETELSGLPEFIIDGMKSFDRIFLNVSFNNFGSLTVSSAEPLDDASTDLLLRFAKVFDSTYTRFNDLQKAETQTREAQIQLALERLRARTMAMHRSDELVDASLLFFQQIKELGEVAIQNSIAIINEKTGFVELSTTIYGSHTPYTLNVPIDEPYLMIKVLQHGRQNVNH